MTEDEAKAWIEQRFDTVALDACSLFAAELERGSAHQNLVARSTIECLWSRHIVDSAQLVDLAEPNAKSWADVGTGGGLPGFVAALLSPIRFDLIEPRRKRVEFLTHCVEKCGLSDRVAVHHNSVERVSLKRADIISARAVGPITALFEMAGHVANERTQWLLPRGRSAKDELSASRQTWAGTFHVEQSITDPDSGILIASGVRRR